MSLKKSEHNSPESFAEGFMLHSSLCFQTACRSALKVTSLHSQIAPFWCIFWFRGVFFGRGGLCFGIVVGIYVCLDWLRSVHQILFWRRTHLQRHQRRAVGLTHWSLFANVCFGVVTLCGYPLLLWVLVARTHVYIANVCYIISSNLRHKREWISSVLFSCV